MYNIDVFGVGNQFLLSQLYEYVQPLVIFLALLPPFHLVSHMTMPDWMICKCTQTILTNTCHILIFVVVCLFVVCCVCRQKQWQILEQPVVTLT